MKLVLLFTLCVAHAAHAEEAEKKKDKIVVLSGQNIPESLVAGDTFPAMADRPDALKPEPLPERVRYKFADDKDVVAAAALLKSQLLQEVKEPGKLFDDNVMIQPGAWKCVKSNEGIGKINCIPTTAIVPNANEKLTLNGMVIKDKEEEATLGKVIREIIRKDGGATVRALKTDEMSKLWTYIAIDIEEPILVVDTANHAHIFVCDFLHNKICTMEELNSLPDSDEKPVVDTPSRKSKDGFGAQLLLTDDGKVFKVQNKAGIAKIKALEKAQRNVLIHTAILITDPGTDANGEANVTCDITVRKPDGTVDAEQKDMVGRRSIIFPRTTGNSPRNTLA